MGKIKHTKLYIVPSIKKFQRLFPTKSLDAKLFDGGSLKLRIYAKRPAFNLETICTRILLQRAACKN